MSMECGENVEKPKKKSLGKYCIAGGPGNVSCTNNSRTESHRLILNLKKLNQYITYHHFKMESLQSAVQLLKKDYWMAVLDLKDAYYSVPINIEHKKFLRFEFKGSLYEFTCLPNGLAPMAHYQCQNYVCLHVLNLYWY